MDYVIFANGEMSDLHIDLPEQAGIIAADGGIRHCLKLGITPQAVIGDFDSITPNELAFLKTSDSSLIRYPADKDETDLELALNYAMENGAINITLFGLLGGRQDMSFANIMLLASPRYEKVNFHVKDGSVDMFILRGGNRLTLHGKPGELVSVIPLGMNAKGITYTGLAWSLKKAILPFGSPRGISNYMLENLATISLDSGILLVMKGHQDSSTQ